MTDISPIRTLIIDDSAVIRQMLSGMLKEDPEIEVVGTAVDPFEAREKIKQLNPDVITLDIEMPKMDGITFLEKIMSLRPMPVVMVSTLTQKGADVTLQALELGAVDYVSKPTAHRPGEGMEALKDEIIVKVKAAAKANVRQLDMERGITDGELAYTARPEDDAARVIAIGSSTGGVEALRELLSPLPDTLPPIVFTQHMQAQFTSALATRLDGLTKLKVVHAQHGLRLQPGHAYLAPGDQHLVVAKQGSMFICRLDDGSPVSGHKPSVDMLFSSVSKAYGDAACGVILTGMGKDGAIGLKEMHDAGAFTIGQNEESSVVYGMPRAAMEAGAVQEQLPLSRIPARIIEHLSAEKVHVA